jgi:hypothetical protein
MSLPVFELQNILVVLLPVAIASPFGVVAEGALDRMPGIIAPRPPQTAGQRRRALGRILEPELSRRGGRMARLGR